MKCNIQWFLVYSQICADHYNQLEQFHPFKKKPCTFSYHLLPCFPNKILKFLYWTWMGKVKVKVKVAQLCPTLCNSMDYTVHGILQARILEWVAFPSSRGSSKPRDRTQVACIAGGFFTSWATREAQEYWSGEPIPSPADLSDQRI